MKNNSISNLFVICHESLTTTDIICGISSMSICVFAIYIWIFYNPPPNTIIVIISLNDMILKALCNNFWLFAHETEVIGIFKVAYKIWYMSDLGPWLEEEEEGFSNRVSLFYNCYTYTCTWNVALFLFTLPVKFLLVDRVVPRTWVLYCS